VPNGLIYIDTTEAEYFIDGQITVKQEYNIAAPRLRTYWDEDRFEKLLDRCGFDLKNNEDLFIHRKNFRTKIIYGYFAGISQQTSHLYSQSFGIECRRL
jgi:hypothetical protein